MEIEREAALLGQREDAVEHTLEFRRQFPMYVAAKPCDRAELSAGARDEIGERRAIVGREIVHGDNARRLEVDPAGPPFA
jgi:hypothetical protein